VAVWPSRTKSVGLHIVVKETHQPTEAALAASTGVRYEQCVLGAARANNLTKHLA